MELTDTMNNLDRAQGAPAAGARRGRSKPLGELQLLGLVGLLCLLPLLVLALFAARAHMTALANAGDEMREQAYVASLERFVTAVAAYQRHAGEWLAGSAEARPAMQRAASEGGQAVAAIEAATGPDPLAPAPQWRQLKSGWTQLASLQGVEALRAPELAAALLPAVEQFLDLAARNRSERQAARLAAVQQQATWAAVAAGAALAAALAGVVIFGRRLLVQLRRRQAQAAQAAQENERNQAAILQLMDELSVIAGGDLTAQAAVTEQITGAIADSINVTVGQLRKVVSDINRASDKVAQATEQAQQTARRLIADSTRQAEDIEAADVSVEMMTASMSEVSSNANESAQVARRSLSTAERGARAVQDSIGGMNEIRQQIQETAKRIKRLGESSQEIGEIVDVITEIAEQTNVLALNAAIQAAAAGEGGRAFAVVAEEVQLLAERSAEATTQIAGLVRAIQADTQEAAAAMESSIQGVVEGARLSDTAGRSLHEIEAVTRDLSEMIQRIAVNTETQVVVAEEVRKIMRDVLTVTGTTTEGSQRAATAVTEIAAQTQSLKASVTQFSVA